MKPVFNFHGNNAHFSQILANKSCLNTVQDVLDCTEDCYVVCNGRRQEPSSPLEDDHVYHVVARLVGGKGGFGSMLRAIGAQIEKTTNREACRDLSGRRMRDVNNEKKLKDWVGKAGERQKEREERKKERLERRKFVPQHKFNDPTYEKQKSKVLDDLHDAVRHGMEKSESAASTSGAGAKRKTTAANDKAKKQRGSWLGVDMDDLSSSDSEASDSGGSKEDEAMETGSSSNDDTAAAPQKASAAAGSSSSSSCTSTQSAVTSSSSADPAKEKATAKQPSATTTSTEHAQSSSDPVDASKQSTQQTENPTKQDNNTEEEVEVKLEDYSSAGELESVGLNSLKTALMSRGLKCGGSLQERAARLYSVKELSDDQIDPSLKAKSFKNKKNKSKQ